MGGVTRAVSSVFGGKSKPPEMSPLARQIADTLDPTGEQRRFKARTGRNLFASLNKGGGFGRSLGQTTNDVEEELLG